MAILILPFAIALAPRAAPAALFTGPAAPDAFYNVTVAHELAATLASHAAGQEGPDAAAYRYQGGGSGTVTPEDPLSSAPCASTRYAGLPSSALT